MTRQEPDGESSTHQPEHSTVASGSSKKKPKKKFRPSNVDQLHTQNQRTNPIVRRLVMLPRGSRFFGLANVRLTSGQLDFR